MARNRRTSDSIQGHHTDLSGFAKNWRLNNAAWLNIQNSRKKFSDFGAS
jgi:hypothetical protein